MKKQLAIFFISIIGCYFASSSLYALHNTNSASEQHADLTDGTSGYLLQYEETPGMEGADDDLAEVSHAVFNVLITHVSFAKEIYTGTSAGSFISACPIYLSTHSIQI